MTQIPVIIGISTKMDFEVNGYRCSVCSRTSLKKSTIVRHTKHTACCRRNARAIPCILKTTYLCDREPTTESNDQQREIKLVDMNIHQRYIFINHMCDAIGTGVRIPIRLSQKRYVVAKTVLEKDDSVLEYAKTFEDFFVAFFRLNGGDKSTNELQYIWRLQNSNVFLIRDNYKFLLRTIEESKDTIFEATKDVLEKFLIEPINSRSTFAYVDYQRTFKNQFASINMNFSGMNKKRCIEKILEYIPIIKN